MTAMTTVTEMTEQVANRASGRNQWIRDACVGMDSILDIGSANGWVFRDSNLNVTLLDINEYPLCELRRVIGDAHDLPFDDGEFDCCVLAEILEHVHNPILVLRETFRVAQKRIIITVPNELSWSPDHLPLATLPSRREMNGREYYLKSNPDCVKVNDSAQALHNRVYSKELLLKHMEYAGCVGEIWIGTIEYSGWSWIAATIDKKPVGRMLIKVNLGSFIDTIDGWENLDILPLQDKINPDHIFKQWDVRNGLPYAEGSVDLINCSHLVEHLSLDDAKKLLGEIYRVLKPDGVVRISTPDVKVIIRHFISSDMEIFDSIQPDEYVQAKTQGEKLSMLLYSLDYQHKAVYSYEMLSQYLMDAGFQHVYENNESSISNVIENEVPVRHKEISLVVEAKK